MKKGLLLLFLALYTCFSYSQELSGNALPERFPVFSGCENLQGVTLENCFYDQVQDFVFPKF